MPNETPFTIIVDNREKNPYTFDGVPARRKKDGAAMALVERRYLPTGDYSIDGYENKIAVERKSLEDLYGTLGRNHQRFEREMARLMEMNIAYIVIEATLAEICRPAEHRYEWRSKASPRAIYGTMVSWQLKYPQVRWWLAGTRAYGQMVTFHLLEDYWTKQQ